MFQKVSVLVPTRRRPGRLATMLDSYASTTRYGSSELVFRIDDDDDLSPPVLEPCGHRVVVGKRMNGYQSMAAFFNELYAAATGDVLMCGNDDMVFKTPGWDQLILDAANEHVADGLFCFGTKTHNETHYPFAIISKQSADRMGYFWHPSVAWGDLFLRDVFATFGRAEILHHVEIAHDWIGFAPDQTFNEENQSSIWQTDWATAHQRAVSDAVSKLTMVPA